METIIRHVGHGRPQDNGNKLNRQRRQNEQRGVQIDGVGWGETDNQGDHPADNLAGNQQRNALHPAFFQAVAGEERCNNSSDGTGGQQQAEERSRHLQHVFHKVGRRAKLQRVHDHHHQLRGKDNHRLVVFKDELHLFFQAQILAGIRQHALGGIEIAQQHQQRG